MTPQQKEGFRKRKAAYHRYKLAHAENKILARENEVMKGLIRRVLAKFPQVGYDPVLFRRLKEVSDHEKEEAGHQSNSL